MEERRQSVRKPHTCRTHYCPSNDLELREGRLVNLSEHGAGLLARESHQHGELVTVGFSLPGHRETLTATGVVRWSGSQSETGPWVPLGLDWLPLEEATRLRFRRFLDEPAKTESAPSPDQRRSATERGRRRLVLSAWIIVALVAGGLLALWTGSLYSKNRRLQAAVTQRDSAINYLGQEGAQLSRELGAAKAHLAATTGEVARLDQQAQRMGQEVGRLSTDVVRFQQSYLQVQEERDQLQQRVLGLEQERAEAANRLLFAADVRLAVQEAIQSRRDAARVHQEALDIQRRMLVQARWEADQQRLADGNRGFVIRDGQPTIGAAPTWIRVHEPQSSPSR